MITEILGGVAAKLAGLTMAAKAGIGVGVATAAITTAGVAGVVPVPGLDSNGQKPAVEVELPVDVQLPEVPTTNAELGLQTANDAIAGHLEVTTGKPEHAGKPEVTGVDRARQTPAGEHIPSHVPGPPASVGAAGSGAASAGLERAGQTPARDYLPSFVPGPPAAGPSGSPSGSPGAVGTDIAKQTPAAGRLSR